MLLNISFNPRKEKGQTRGFAQKSALAEFDELIESPELAEQVEKINTETDEKEQEKLKDQLPFYTPHYLEFTDNHRCQACIKPESFTFETVVDIDNREQVEQANQRSDELNEEKGGLWEGMMLRKDYSARRKLHIAIRLPIGMTVAEAQRAYCKALGVDPDEACFSPERFIYLTPKSHEIYRSEEWCKPLSEDELEKRRKAYTDRGLTIDGRTEEGGFYDPEKKESKPKKKVSAANSQPSASYTAESELPKKFKNIPYTDIVNEFWNYTGGEPAEGERNVMLHKLAVNLRAICDNNTELLMAIMPRYGLDEQEMRTIVNSACKEQPKGISKIIQNIVKDLSDRYANDASGECGTEQAKTITVPSQLTDAMKRNLPIGLKESLIGVPKGQEMAVLASILPIAGAYADGVELLYCDGNTHYLGLMTIIKGGQASGKSGCKSAIMVWKRSMDEQDAIARRIEDEWKERKKNRKANEKAPDDPKVCIRCVPVTISCSALLRRLKNSNGHTLFSYTEEADTLTKSNNAGSWSMKYDIYRLGFDRGEWGQDYNSDQAESGSVEVAYNWTIFGTDGAIQKMFKGENVENGLSSRILISTLQDTSFAKMPKYQKRSAEDDERIVEATKILSSYSGFIDTPKLRKAIEKWVEQKRVEAAKDIDIVKDIFRRRSAVIGFRCGVIYALLDGGKETRNATNFAVMMAEYCLDQQIKTFGAQLAEQMSKRNTDGTRKNGNKLVFDCIPEVFTIDDLRKHKGNTCNDAALRKIISRWNADKLIEKIDSKQWKKTKSTL